MTSEYSLRYSSMRYDDYKLVRSARKTLSVCVTETNDIVVRAPYRTSVDVIDEFLNEKRGWIEKKIDQNASALSTYEDIRNYSAVLVSGYKRPLHIGDRNSIEEGGVHLQTPSCAENVFVNNLGSDFLRKFREIVDTYDFVFRSVKIRSYKSRWGCCDEHGNISFNFRLLMLSDDVQCYVIAHELCHTIHMDHSANFWNMVGGIVPDYGDIRRELRQYDFLTRLYW